MTTQRILVCYMTVPSDLKNRIKQLCDAQLLCVLSTHQKGQPYANLIAFQITEDLSQILFATPTSTRKYANLSADPRAAFLIDSRSNQDSDFHEAFAITALGNVYEIDHYERDIMAALYLQKHQYLNDFLAAPTTAFFKTKINKYICVSRFQEVMEMHMDNNDTSST